MKNPLKCLNCGSVFYMGVGSKFTFCPVCKKPWRGIVTPYPVTKKSKKKGSNPIQKYEKAFRSDLRYAYKRHSISMFRKDDITKLTPSEINTILKRLLDTYYPIRPYPPGSYEPITKDEFLTIFRDTFKGEIRKMKSGNLTNSNPITAKLVRLVRPIMATCSICGKNIASWEKYYIYDPSNGRFYHLKCFQKSRKNPNRGTHPTLTPNILPDIASSAVAGVGLGIGFKTVDWAAGKFGGKNPKFKVPHIYETTCKRCGKTIYSSRWAMRHHLGRICSACTTPEEKQEILDYQSGIIMKGTKKNPKSTLFRNFHGTDPVKTSKVLFEPPKSGEPILKIGRLSQINYVPESPSRKAGHEFYHKSGDLGHKTIKSNAILATNQQGTQLFIVREKDSKYPLFTERGIIG